MTKDWALKMAHADEGVNVGAGCPQTTGTTPEQDRVRAMLKDVFEQQMNELARQICMLCAKQDIDWRDADLNLWKAATSHPGVQDRLDEAMFW